MNISIIGTGNVGLALAERLAAAHHRIFLGVRDVDQFSNKDQLLDHPSITAHSVEEALKASEVIVIAAPSPVMTELSKQLAPLVGDRIIVDATNPAFGAPNGYSSGYLALKDITKSSNVVKCFNSTFAANIANPVVEGVKLDMFIAGDNEQAKKVATQLAKDVGFGEVYDCGGDDKVALLEGMVPFVVNLAYGQGMGPTFGIKLVRHNSPII